MVVPANIRRGETLNVLTLWQVHAPVSRPLSIMLHLRDAQGQPLVISDGLGFPVEQWHSSDILVQNHIVVIPEDLELGDYTFHTGAYWLDELELLDGYSSVIPIMINP
jgi:hypothetical protein